MASKELIDLLEQATQEEVRDGRAKAEDLFVNVFSMPRVARLIALRVCLETAEAMDERLLGHAIQLDDERSG